MRHPIFFFFLVASLLLSGCNSASDKDQPPASPNIVLIIADDAGYADFGFTGGSDFVRTPNLDKLAENGVVFNQAYVTASVCCPSRMGMMTGRYQQRFGAECNVPIVPTPGYTKADLGLEETEVTMGALLGQQGYKTMMVGKWHLGERAQDHPLDRGFDEFFGFLGGSRSYWGIENPSPGHAMYRNREVLNDTASVSYLTDDLTEATLDFIDRNKKNPFFVYLSYNAVHTPMHAKAEDIEQQADIANKKRRIYAAMSKSMDDNIGRLVAHLKKNNLMENTLLVFVNDNGGASSNASENLPLRGYKGSYWEGGIRIPFLMHWPGKLKAGTQYNHPVSTLDLLPTFLAAANGTSKEKHLDGINLMPYLDGSLGETPHEYLFWRMWRASAVRSGPWKLIRIASDPLQTDRELLAPLILLNLEEDPAEQNNVAEKYPDITLRLQQQLELWEKELVQPRWHDGSDWQHWAEVQVKNHQM